MTTSGLEAASPHIARKSTDHILLSSRDASDTARLLKILSNAKQDPVAKLLQGVELEPAITPLARAKGSSGSRTSAKQVLIARRVRGQFLDDTLFNEPGWDMLLALYSADDSEARCSISRLTDYSGAAPSTALRWICILERLKLIRRVSHPTDLRTVFIELTVEARRKLDNYFSRIDAMRLTAGGNSRISSV